MRVLTMSKCQASDWAMTEEAARVAPKAVRTRAEPIMLLKVGLKCDV